MNLQEFYIVIYAMFVKNTDTNKFCWLFGQTLIVYQKRFFCA